MHDETLDDRVIHLDMRISWGRSYLTRSLGDKGGGQVSDAGLWTRATLDGNSTDLIDESIKKKTNKKNGVIVF